MTLVRVCLCVCVNDGYTHTYIRHVWINALIYIHMRARERARERARDWESESERTERGIATVSVYSNCIYLRFKRERERERHGMLSRERDKLYKTEGERLIGPRPIYETEWGRKRHIYSPVYDRTIVYPLKAPAATMTKRIKTENAFVCGPIFCFQKSMQYRHTHTHTHRYREIHECTAMNEVCVCVRARAQHDYGIHLSIDTFAGICDFNSWVLTVCTPGR